MVIFYVFQYILEYLSFMKQAVWINLLYWNDFTEWSEKKS